MSTSPTKGLSRSAVRELRATFDAAMDDFDADLVTAAEALEISRDLTAMKNRLAYAEAACARRVAATSVTATRSDRDGTKAAARRLGVSNGEAANLLKLADDLEHCPATKDAFEAGRLSPQQAAEVARTVTSRPEAERAELERQLVSTAQRESLGELKQRCRDARAKGQDDAARARRQHAERHLRTWVDKETGAGCGRWSLPIERHAEVMAALGPWREELFGQARREGRREDPSCYDADALVELARDAVSWAEHTHDGADDHRDDGGGGADDESDNAEAPGTTSGGEARTPSAGAGAPHEPASSPPPERTRGSPHGRAGPPRRPRRSRDKLILRADWSAVQRGHTEPGEVCDIVGVGPVPVAAVREVLAGDPIIAALATDGVDIRAVTHLGRKATALMRTALEWADQGCSVLGCPNRARLEVDHRVDWAQVLRTRLDELDLLCHGHHLQKTHDGYRLEPGRGKRRFLSPQEQEAVDVVADRPPPEGEPPPDPRSYGRTRDGDGAGEAHRSGAPPGRAEPGSPSRIGIAPDDGDEQLPFELAAP